MNHPASEYLEPAGVLADPASLPGAEEACDIHLRARFSEREVAGPEAVFYLAPVELPRKRDKRTLELTEGDSPVDIQSLDLVKEAIAACTDRLISIDSSRNDHPHRRFLAFHDPNLDGGCVSS